MKLLSAVIAPAFCAALASPVFALCPDPSLEGATYDATGADLISPQSWDVRAQGDHIAPCANWALADWNTGGLSGYLPLAPTAAFDLSGMAPHILVVAAQAECRAVLAVRSGDGQWFFADQTAAGPQVTLWGVPDGPLQVWVGSLSEAGCDGALTLETFDR